MKMKLQSKEDVRLAIRRRGQKIASQMEDREIFLSKEFIDYTTHLADFILRKHKLYSLDIQYDNAPNGPIAYTDGKKIFCNTGNYLAAKPKLLERRFKVNMGIIFHECAHKLFMDFTYQHKAMDSIQSGKLFGNFPASDDLSPEYAASLEELKSVVKSPYSAALTSVFHGIENRLSDGHDEAAMKRYFPGFIADCITTAGEVQFENSGTLEQMIENRLPDYAIYENLILEYAKYGTYNVGESTPAAEKYLEKMQEVESLIDAAILMDSYAERWDVVNQLVLFLWPFIRDQFPDNPPEQSGNGSSAASGSGANSNAQNSSGSPQAGNGTSDAEPSVNNAPAPPTPEEVQKALEDMENELGKAMNQAPAPVNGSGKAIDVSELSPTAASSSGMNCLPQILQSLSEEQAARQVQKELNREEMDAIRNMNVPLVHKNISLTIKRDNTPNEEKYSRISNEIAPVVRNLVSQMRSLLREMNEECIQHHKRMGPMVEATEAYRPDRSFFAKKKLPEDLPDMALCVLIDQSGSMYGEKLECAIRTAILLEQFADALDIPLMIAGHNVSWHSVDLRIFTDFLSAMTKKDRYSLAGITDGGCNRDGLPIRACANLLAQRQEKVRLMVIISDGAPHDADYCGEKARKDISDTVAEFRRKGLLIYGAAIDDDRDVIQQIYGKGFLSIQNLETLPKTLVRLIRQQMI